MITVWKKGLLQITTVGTILSPITVRRNGATIATISTATTNEYYVEANDLITIISSGQTYFNKRVDSSCVMGLEISQERYQFSISHGNYRKDNSSLSESAYYNTDVYITTNKRITITDYKEWWYGDGWNGTNLQSLSGTFNPGTSLLGIMCPASTGYGNDSRVVRTTMSITVYGVASFDYGFGAFGPHNPSYTIDKAIITEIQI